jgi:hypothetical protein
MNFLQIRLSGNEQIGLYLVEIFKVFCSRARFSFLFFTTIFLVSERFQIDIHLNQGTKQCLGIRVLRQGLFY